MRFVFFIFIHCTIFSWLVTRYLFWYNVLECGHLNLQNLNWTAFVPDQSSSAMMKWSHDFWSLITFIKNNFTETRNTSMPFSRKNSIFVCIVQPYCDYFSAKLPWISISLSIVFGISKSIYRISQLEIKTILKLI